MTNHRHRVALLILLFCAGRGCQARVSAEGGSASTEHTRKVLTPKTTTVIVEKWTPTTKKGGGQ